MRAVIECTHCGEEFSTSIWKAIKYRLISLVRGRESLYMKYSELYQKHENLKRRHDDNLQRTADLANAYRDMAKSYERIAAVIEKIHSPAVKAKEDHIT